MDKSNKNTAKKKPALDSEEMLKKILNDAKPKRYGKEEENPFDIWEKQKEQEEASRHSGDNNPSLTNTSVPVNLNTDIKTTEIIEPTTVAEITESTTTTDVTKVTEAIEVTEATEVTDMDRLGPSATEESTLKETSPPKATRISAKMRRRSREEFCDTYLKKCNTKGGKPVTMSRD